MKFDVERLQEEEEDEVENINTTTCSRLFKNTLIWMFGRLKELKTYQLDAFPITDKIVAAWIKQNTQLESLKLHTKNYKLSSSVAVDDDTNKKTCLFLLLT